MHDKQNYPQSRAPLPTRRVYLFGGYALFALGLIGAMLPVLPTTVFWIGAAICFSKSSPRMYRRILATPAVGPAVADFIDHGTIARKGKICAVTGMAAASIAVGLTPLGALPTAIALGVILLAAIYVLTRPSRPPKNNPRDVEHYPTIGTRPVGG